MDAAIQTEHLTKVYRGRVIAVNDMRLTVPRGSIFGLLGPNGAGKTTTLKLLLGLQRASAGQAFVFGHRCAPGAVAVRRTIGYLPTHPSLPGQLTSIEYLDLVGQLCGLAPTTRKPRLASLLRAVGLLGATSQRIRTYSTGMATRLGIAASLMADPPLLIWDEPTAGLDPAARRFTLDLIRALGEDRTVLVATHILSDIDQICDHVGVMQEGQMIFCGTMRDLKRRLRRDAFLLELECTAEQLEFLVTEVNAIDRVAARAEADHVLAVRLDDPEQRAGQLARVLELVHSTGARLQSIRSGQNETEHAYLQLLQEEATHGFQRFSIRPDAPASAADGHLPA